MARQWSGIPGQQAEPLGAWNSLAALSRLRRRRTGRREADYLDNLVNTELEFIRQLPEQQRSRPAEALALLAMLAQDHRQYGRGWISRRELRDRVERTLIDLDAMRQVPAEQPL
ncbi:MAG: hypothetical protein ACRDTA_29980 [Pseudonocardiaceae bacterium]